MERRQKRRGVWLAAVLLFSFSFSFRIGAAESTEAAQLVQAYLDAWVAFYPSRAYADGHAPSAAAFEDYAPERLQAWIGHNTAVASAARRLLNETELATSTALDLQVLAQQVEAELAHWQQQNPTQTQPQWYSEQISQALTHLLVRAADGPVRSAAAIRRLEGVEMLCLLGTETLQQGRLGPTRTALRTLKGTQAFYNNEFARMVAQWPAAADGRTVSETLTRVLPALAALIHHVENAVLPEASPQPGMGEARYAAGLARRTGGRYTPDSLRAVALEEVRAARALMQREAVRWYRSLPEAGRPALSLSLTDQAAAAAGLADLPAAEPSAGAGSAAEARSEALLALALEAMEQARDTRGAELLASFTGLTFAAERFVIAQDLASVPQPTTLKIALSPAHFSGAAVGGVYPSGPFDPDADTLFYLPSVPDSAPEAVREGFYRSFNTHFNTMIIAHEMFPGHYLQYKVAVAAAPPVRTLFPNGPYVEGWGTFVEELMLDAGWADNAPLTRLAHLRKRLENATRAYVSVQVNTADWGEAEVLAFARDEGLLAPQFASNLWQRVLNSPLQLGDYMSGYLQFRQLYADREAMGFATVRDWVDAILRAGPLPLDLLPQALAAAAGPEATTDVRPR
ncbi:DUF885 family protein [Chromatocurvus halotolerans]|uniref:Uncharacterized protein (DUF885 family) n=1 Tax=Chromatocurvus halotolerans TaxID=1132028 RepID=A0A4R2KPA1_9GAMM|nr:DUF885 family protein [Chromatocurvus halotolerans]TCO75543.1 uncharacterized protein (DUF885 family) [Chromatocurvus halotolerans]